MTIPNWSKKQKELIANCSVFAGLPPESMDQDQDQDRNSRESVIRAVNLDTKHVTAARDQNGNQIGNTNTPITREPSSTLLIRRLTSDESEATAKAEWIMRDFKADQNIGKMTHRERIEFFWCYAHGLMTITETTHRDFASCMHYAPMVTSHDGRLHFDARTRD